MDLYKAFRRVDHDIFLQKLSHNGIGRLAKNWFLSSESFFSVVPFSNIVMWNAGIYLLFLE